MVSSTQLSRLVSHALRHEPWLYELELDDEGWVPVDALLAAVHQQGPEWSQVGRSDLAGMIASSSKQRHDLDGDRIRALYGHSVPGRFAKVEAEPPARLFHGTSPSAWELIRHDGLRPMRRQFVHLSVDVAMATQVGRRKAADPVILQIDASNAHATGVSFWRGNELVWLADSVPPTFITTAVPAEDHGV